MNRPAAVPILDRSSGRQPWPRALVLLTLLHAVAPVVAASAVQHSPPGNSYLVTRVVDGDTIVLERIGKVRLIGVDTPETVDPRRPVQRFGKEAGDFTRRLVDGKRVRVEYDWNRKDKYNRTLAYIYLADGTLVNAEIIRQGYGVAYTRFPFKYLDEFRKIEREARGNERGLWAPAGSTSSSAKPKVGTQSTPAPVTVYVTRTGTKYHRADCRLVARGSISIPLTEAIKKYGPCAICKPPVP
jgi:micrococcal nuclease